MSELGVGDELFDEDKELPPQTAEQVQELENATKKMAVDDGGVNALPIVVIRNFAAGSSTRDDALTVLSQWIASLAEGGVGFSLPGAIYSC